MRRQRSQFGVEWSGALSIFTGGAGDAQTWFSHHSNLSQFTLTVMSEGREVRPTAGGLLSQHMAVLVRYSDNIRMFPWIVNGNSWPWFGIPTCHQRILSRLCYNSFKGKRCCEWQSVKRKKPNWQNTGYWSQEQVGPEGPEVSWSPLVEMSPWVQFDSNAYISGVPTLGTSPKSGIWSIKKYQLKIVDSLIFQNSIFRWRMAQAECIWMCVKFVSFRSVIDERG